jgi:hypothetical protein
MLATYSLKIYSGYCKKIVSSLNIDYKLINLLLALKLTASWKLANDELKI